MLLLKYVPLKSIRFMLVSFIFQRNIFKEDVDFYQKFIPLENKLLYKKMSQVSEWIENAILQRERKRVWKLNWNFVVHEKHPLNEILIIVQPTFVRWFRFYEKSILSAILLFIIFVMLWKSFEWANRFRNDNFSSYEMFSFSLFASRTMYGS